MIKTVLLWVSMVACVTLASLLVISTVSKTSPRTVPGPIVTKTEPGPTITVTDNPSLSSISLNFNCTVPSDSEDYYLTITNDNSFPVTIGEVVVAFYDSNGNQIGTDNAMPGSIDTNTTYNYTGKLYAVNLSGIPAVCKELQWYEN